MSKIKKILLILNGLLLIVVLILGIYYWRHYFGGKSGTTPGTNGTTPPTNGVTPPITKPRVFLVTDKEVMAPHLPALGNQIQYFALPDYEIYAATYDGQTEAKISSPNFVIKELIKVIWAPGQNQLIAVFANENNQIQKYFYDLTTNLSNLLDPAMRAVAFSPDGQKIVFHYLNDQTGENAVAVSEPTGLNRNVLWQAKVRDWQVAWPALDKIILQTPTSNLAPGLAYEINPETNEHSRVFTDARGLETLGSPNGQRMLFSKIVNSQPRLFIKTSEAIQDLEVAGLVSKCLWQDNDNLYCGLSENWPQGLTLPDDYYKGLVSVNDAIWHFDLSTNQKTQIASPDEFDTVLDISQILASPDNDYLFILNKKDNHLYGIRL